MITRILLLMALPASALASEGAAHADPVGPVMLSLAMILLGAKLGGHLAMRLAQPPVLGELLTGIVLGNLHYAGFHAFDFMPGDTSIDMLARLGVILLLFEVGLESTIKQMMEVGLSSLAVACVGVVAPFGLGWGVSAWLLPEHTAYVHAFIGATLTATSVGITARVLKDMEKSQTPEARVILGAAVIDDVLGLVILAVVSGVIAAADTGGKLSIGDTATILGKAAGFLVGSLVLGYYLTPPAFRVASKIEGPGVLLAAGLSFCFVLSWLAGKIGLAPIVGAFAAGLILEDVHYKNFEERGEHGLEELVRPIAAFLVPVFFVLMGMRTDLAAFAKPGVLGLAFALTIAAIVGKQACSLAVLTPGADRITVGIGMIPRGEVGLIFANIGLGLKVGGEHIIDPPTFSACVVMVIVTTLVTPPLLQWRMTTGGSRSSGAGSE